MNLQKLEIDQAYVYMKFDIDGIEGFWYCHETDNCVVETCSEFEAYKFEDEEHNRQDFDTFEECIKYLEN